MRTVISSLGRLTRSLPAADVPEDAIPKGTVIEFTMKSSDSKIYPGIARDREYLRHRRSRRSRQTRS